MSSEGDTAVFRLHVSDAGVTTLAGEVDRTNAELFEAALEQASFPVRNGQVVIDGRELTFLDHRALICLADRVARDRAVLLLRVPWASVVGRMARLLDLPNIEVERTR